jgi:hypothetical protein
MNSVANWARKKAKQYTDAVALHGVPVEYPKVVNGTWRVFDPVQNKHIDTGESPGIDGLTPHIGDNGNWWIGDTDTGKLGEVQNIEFLSNAEIQEIINNL